MSSGRSSSVQRARCCGCEVLPLVVTTGATKGARAPGGAGIILLIISIMMPHQQRADESKAKARRGAGRLFRLLEERFFAKLREASWARGRWLTTLLLLNLDVFIYTCSVCNACVICVCVDVCCACAYTRRVQSMTVHVN